MKFLLIDSLGVVCYFTVTEWLLANASPSIQCEPRPNLPALATSSSFTRAGLVIMVSNPFLDAGLVSFLIERGIRTIGLDALNIDETPDADHPGEGFPTHHLIAKVGGVICENLCNLESVDFADPLVSLLPMKFVGIDGAPVRAVAMEMR